MDQEVKEDRLLDGRVRVQQPTRGYRAGMDAALLAAACPVGPSDRLIEAGSGVGAVLLQIAARRPGASFVGIERTEAAINLAQRNILANQMPERIEVRYGDIAEGFRPLDLPVFDWAISNPPFFEDANRLRAPAPERRDAWIADDGLAAWTTFLSKAVREGGIIVMIHRADALAEILGQLSPKAGSFQILPIHPFADQPAKRVIVRATKSGKAPLQVLPGLVLHDHSGAKHTPQAEALLRGQAEISWR